MKWYIKVLKNYGTFSGRASRTEYWMFVLVNFVISFILSFIQFVIDKPLFLPVIYSLLVAVPSLAVEQEGSTIREKADGGSLLHWFH